MGQLRKQSTELNRLKKMKEENDKMVRKMTEEVVGLKAMRVKHIRQMKADAEEFRKWKQASAKEVLFSSCVYEKWNNIPHYTQTEINGRGPCEPPSTNQ